MDIWARAASCRAERCAKPSTNPPTTHQSHCCQYSTSVMPCLLSWLNRDFFPGVLEIWRPSSQNISESGRHARLLALAAIANNNGRYSFHTHEIRCRTLDFSSLRTCSTCPQCRHLRHLKTDAPIASRSACSMRFSEDDHDFDHAHCCAIVWLGQDPHDFTDICRYRR